MSRKKPLEQVAGRFSAIPHSVLDSVAFMCASYRAKSLLLELIRQLNGSNNGHLQLSGPWLKSRGWCSADAIQKAKLELVNRQLIVKSRHGGLNAGPDKWAVTWLVISDFAGLDFRAGQHIPGAWHLFVEPEKQKKHSVQRSGTAPLYGTGTPSAAPYNGAKTALFDASTAPYNGNNVFTNVPGTKGKKRIVGKAGKSGKKASAPETAQPTATGVDCDLMPSAGAASGGLGGCALKFIKAMGQQAAGDSAPKTSRLCIPPTIH